MSVRPVLTAAQMRLLTGLVITLGGPYLIELDKLMDRRELAANSRTVISYDTSAPGQDTMVAYTTNARTSPDFASAAPDVRTAGGR